MIKFAVFIKKTHVYSFIWRIWLGEPVVFTLTSALHQNPSAVTSACRMRVCRRRPRVFSHLPLSGLHRCVVLWSDRWRFHWEHQNNTRRQKTNMSLTERSCVYSVCWVFEGWYDDLLPQFGDSRLNIWPSELSPVVSANNSCLINLDVIGGKLNCLDFKIFILVSAGLSPSDDKAF